MTPCQSSDLPNPFFGPSLSRTSPTYVSVNHLRHDIPRRSNVLNKPHKNGTKSNSPQGGIFHRLRLAIILLSLFVGTFLVAIDTIIISIAIPKTSTEFQRLSDVGWYDSAYLITITALQPAGGTIYKLFNVKLVYLVSIAIFESDSPSLLWTLRSRNLTHSEAELNILQLARRFVPLLQTPRFSSLEEASPA